MPMFAPCLKNLRVKLQERKDAVLRAKFGYLESHLKTFLNFVCTQPVLSAITNELDTLLPRDDKEKVLKGLNSSPRHQIELPGEEGLKAAHLLIILKYLVDPSFKSQLHQKMSLMCRGRDFQEQADEYTEQLFLPLYHYYDERLDDADLLLYILLKYKRMCEWFDRDRLFNLASEESGKKEASLDLHLRRFLMQEGFDYPFSTPHSPKGRTDIVVHIEEKPLPLEIKIFDGDSCGKSYLKKGFNQALRYAEDYHQPTGYLVVFNLSEKLLQFGKTSSDNYFPKIEAQNKTIFIVPVNIHPITISASREKEAQIAVIEQEYLISPEL